MFHQSSSRNHRSKGSNVKKILQVIVLLAVACWLLYQVKHSREKKNDHAVNDEMKLSKLGEEIYLGRKGDAGSENVVILDTNAKGSDESIEMKQDEVQHDALVLENEDISKAVPRSHELAHSQGSKPEEHTYSHASNGEDILLLPSEEGRNNTSGQNGNSNKGGSKLEENEHLNDNEINGDVKGDLVADDSVEVTMTGSQITSNSSDQTKNSENSGKENEETSGGVDSQEMSMNGDVSEGKGISSYEHNSNMGDDHAREYTRSDDAHISSSQGYAATTNDQVDTEFHEQKNVDADNEASKEEEVETQLGIVFGAENKANSSREMKTDRESEKEMMNSFSHAEPQNSSDTSGVVFVESQTNRTSFDSLADRVSEHDSTSEANNNVDEELQANNEDFGEAENSQNNSLESKIVTDNPREEISTADSVESQGNEGGKSEENSDVIDKEDSTVIDKEDSTVKGGKNEAALNDEATSLDVNEETHLEDLTNNVPAGKIIQAEGGSISDAEGTSGSNEDKSKTELSSDVETQQQREAAEQKNVQ